MHFVLILLIIVVYLGVENVLHERRLKRIPIRIHVNGTRGKSSVVRLIAETLRKAGVRTLAKTTGTNPKLIYPDGREEQIRRRGPSRIQEQVRFIRRAARLKAEAVVVECMAIEPQLQFASERRMIRSTLGVITNVRPDHFEVMGEKLDDIAESLSQTIPWKADLITGDRRYFTYFKEKAAGLKTRVHLAEEVQPGTTGDEGGLIHSENVAIARKACSLIDRIPASLIGPVMDEGKAAGTLPIAKATFHDTRVHFIDAFSANDVESTRRIQSQVLNESHYPRPFIALLNNRSDRPLRMLSFASFLSQERIYDYILLVGESLRLTRRHLRRSGSGARIVSLKRCVPEELLEEICEKIPHREFTILGMGNYRGPGEGLIRFFRERGER